MARLELTFSHFEQLLKNGYNLDMVFLLKLIQKEKCNISELCKEDPKLSAIYQGLVRKKLISADCKLMLEGRSILDFLSSPAEETFRKRLMIDDGKFDEWWNTYPGTDIFTHKGKSFSGSRGMRVQKDECKLRLNKVLEEGEYTLDQLIEALKFDVLQKKENSVNTGTNKLTFMQNSLTYINQRSFEPFIELIKEGQKIVEAPQQINSTDI